MKLAIDVPISVSEMLLKCKCTVVDGRGVIAFQCQINALLVAKNAKGRLAQFNRQT
jgi:hypothetical protein